MRTHSAVACALGLAASLGGCAVHAQTITRQTAALPGKLVIASDQGTMFRVGAGGPASLSMKAFSWLSGTAPMKPSTGWPSTKA